MKIYIFTSIIYCEMTYYEFIYKLRYVHNACHDCDDTCYNIINDVPQ